MSDSKCKAFVFHLSNQHDSHEDQRQCVVHTAARVTITGVGFGLLVNAGDAHGC